jgi:Transposase
VAEGFLRPRSLTLSPFALWVASGFVDTEFRAMVPNGVSYDETGIQQRVKLEAVKLTVEHGASCTKVASDLGIGSNVVSHWVREPKLT